MHELVFSATEGGVLLGEDFVSLSGSLNYYYFLTPIIQLGTNSNITFRYNQNVPNRTIHSFLVGPVINIPVTEIKSDIIFSLHGGALKKAAPNAILLGLHGGISHLITTAGNNTAFGWAVFLGMRLRISKYFSFL